MAAKNRLKKAENKTSKSNKTRKTKSNKGKSIISFLKNERTHQSFGILLIAFGIFLFIAFTSYITNWKHDDNIINESIGSILFKKDVVVQNWMGKIGSLFSYALFKKTFGLLSYSYILLILLFGIKLSFDYTILPIKKTIIYSAFFTLWGSTTLGFILHNTDYSIYGGAFGVQSTEWLSSVVGQIGTVIALLVIILIFSIIEFNLSFKGMLNAKEKEKLDESDIESQEEIISQDDEEEEIEETEEDDEDEQDIFDFSVKKLDTAEEVEIEEETVTEAVVSKPEDEVLSTEETGSDDFEIIIPTEDSEISEDEDDTPLEHYTVDTQYDPRLDLSSYQFPTIDLLEDYPQQEELSVKTDELHANKNRIIETLKNYGIPIDKIFATIGPTVTLYEIVPAPGVRISKIKNLEDDIALSLAALGIRIIAPIPGKGTIGIEVPNSKPDIVPMKTILSSDKFQNSKFDLPIGIGKTITNETFVYDLAKMPHLLMAGATGQGKSVGLNAIIASLLYKKHPAELKFVLVDPKKVELTLFSKIERHFLAKLPDSEEAIITDTKKVVRTVNSLCVEMDERYDLLKDAQCRNIKEYNHKFIHRKLNPEHGHRFLPYIVLVVDEFADLIMTAGKEIEMPIARLAQLARAIGIHLIIATQRPSVNIITGTIKANFPARLAFRVTSKIDSRTILDTSGADQLIGRGDMLLSTGNDIIRLQCAFVDTPEVEKITEFIGSQRAYSTALLLPEVPDDEGEGGGDFSMDDRDALLIDAARFLVQTQHGSTSSLQRRFKVGYNRAGRIIDQLEALGVVGGFEGSKAREVKIKTDAELDIFIQENNLE
ncbi:MAG: DNA translocase FtsK 4TM domain-containing protein [Bacteroidales bacterium]